MQLAGRWQTLYHELTGVLDASPLRFEILHESTKSGARVGILHTPHGSIPTPSFVPVATCGALKCLDLASLELPHPPLVFCNTFHLLCSNTGAATIEKLGGLHRFMGLTQPTALITDSGGFQVFSLADPVADDSASDVDTLKGQRGTKSPYRPGSLLLSITDEGALFRSPLNGDRILLSPELSIQTQKQLGADIIVAMDELSPLSTHGDALLASFQRTHEWELRSLATHVADPRQQAIYGIIHGGKDLSLRQQSLDFLAPLPFHGLAIGGSLGGTQEEMLQILAHLAPALARHPPVARKPRHLLGIGDPFSLRRAVSFGIDTFDSVFPTRAARHGNLFTLDEESLEMQSLPLRNIQFRDDLAPVDPCCPCPVCQRHSRAFLHHLIRAREPLLGVLATTHNLYTWERLMTLLRQRIALNQI